MDMVTSLFRMATSALRVSFKVRPSTEVEKQHIEGIYRLYDEIKGSTVYALILNL